jgi:hypothetical protein
MGLIDLISAPRQQVAYLFPEISNIQDIQNFNKDGPKKLEDIFVFQFWPSQVTDSYTPNWATKQIPGASHPLYQWVGGSGRNISFTANFVAEIKGDEEVSDSFKNFNERIASSAASSTTPSFNAGTAASLPSARYSVNVSAAIAALQQYLYPTYNNPIGITKPPKKLILVLPGTKLGRKDSGDGILCILKSANVTMESWFPTGELRAASVSLQFSEIIQHTSGEGTNIKYIGAEEYNYLAAKYTINADVGGVSSSSSLSF